MKRHGFQIVNMILVASLQFVSGQDLRSEKSVASERNEDMFLQYLKPVLKSAGGASRLYYHADCWTKHGDGILFPRLKLETPSKSKTGLAAIQDVLSKNRHVTVTEGRLGIPRISIGNVREELLNTRIRLLSLKPTERYNGREAISAIEKTKEVQVKMRELRLEHPPTVVSEVTMEPTAGWPHLPASLKNVTMDEALDRVAQTFGGLVIYSECNSANGTRLVSVDFVYIR